MEKKIKIFIIIISLFRVEVVASRQKGHEVSSPFADTVTDPPVNVLKGDPLPHPLGDY